MPFGACDTFFRERMNVTRVLLVSAESSVAALGEALGACAGRWQARCVADSAQAMEALAAGAYDVVIGDVASGPEEALSVLERVKAERPDTARIVLGSRSEPDLSVRVLGAAQQCVAMPCASTELWKVVERTCCMNGLMHHRGIRDLLGGLERLPSVPRSYTAMTQAMAREEIHLGEIVAIVEKDTAMATRILQLINSAYFGQARRISSIPVAVSLLGLERLRTLALSTQVFAMLGEAESRAIRLDQLQQRALVTAQLARRFLAVSGRGEEGFAAGLLQNVGMLVLAVCLKERYREVLDEAGQREVPVERVEGDRFGVTHAEVGACLLGRWGLPATIVEAVAFHHAPASVFHDDTALLDAVHVADAMAEAILQRRGPDAQELAIDPVVLSREGMGETLRAWHAIATQEYGAARS